MSYSQADASFFSNPVFESNAEFRVNTAHFSRDDLALFIESLETLSRLKQERHERRQRRREQVRAAQLLIHAQLLPPTATTNSPSSPVPPISDLPEEQLILLEAKSVSPAPGNVRKTSDDETYFSDAGNSPQNSPTTSNRSSSNSKKLRIAAPTTPTRSYAGAVGSDSEESGVFPIGTDSPPPPQYVPMRPRSKLISEPNTRSARSRIIALIMKRELTQTQAEQSNNEPSRKKSKSNHSLNRNEPVLQELKLQYKRFTMRYLRRKLKTNTLRNTTKAATAELEGLDKALRYLTL